MQHLVSHARNLTADPQLVTVALDRGVVATHLDLAAEVVAEFKRQGLETCICVHFHF